MVELKITNELNSMDIQIHFYFEDENLHSMDAVILNTSERQFIDALRDLNKYLDKPLDIQIHAKKEGGLKEFLQIILDNSITIMLITVIATNFFKPNPRPKLPVSEETKNQHANVMKIKEDIASGKLSEEDFDLIAKDDSKLRKHKSRFFNEIKKIESISHVELYTDTEVNGTKLFDKISVPYKDFNDFIIDDDEIDDEFDIEESDVKIFIISPILFKGKWLHWKGFCNDGVIDFKIADKEFLDKVYSQEIKFQNGTFINCILKTSISKNTNKTLREVVFVSGIGEDENFVKPIKHRHKKTHDVGQELFVFIDDNVNVSDK